MKNSEDPQFINIVDGMILQSETDLELKEALRWIDQQAIKNNISFYEQAWRILLKHCAEKRAKEWMANK